MADSSACNRCGVQIQLATAGRTGGLCMPCKNGTRQAIEAARQEKSAPSLTRRWRDQETREGDLNLAIPHELKRLVSACEAYCQVDCCSLTALDVNAYTMLHWMRAAGIEAAVEARKQLDIVMNLVAGHEGGVVSDDTLCHTWDRAADCLDYFATWRGELLRAFSFHAEGCPSAQQRLREAQQGRDYLEIRRVMGDAGRLLQAGEHSAALEVFALVAALDDGDRAISNEVRWARRVLAEHRGPTSG